jgi:acyl carrier protein
MSSESYEMRNRLHEFVVNNFLFGDASRAPGDDESLIAAGVVDSTGVLELVDFLETDLGVKVEENETLPENLDSIANIVRFVERKTAA